MKKKHSNIKFHENPFSCSIRTDGQADRHEEDISCFAQFCERAIKKKGTGYRQTLRNVREPAAKRAVNQLSGCVVPPCGGTISLRFGNCHHHVWS